MSEEDPAGSTGRGPTRFFGLRLTLGRAVNCAVLAASALQLFACTDPARPQGPVSGLADEVPPRTAAGESDASMASSRKGELFTPRRVRRLSHAEYLSAVASLFGEEARAWTAPLTDPRVHGFDNNAEALTVSSGNFEEFAVSAQVIADSVNVGAIARCAEAESNEACAAAFARDLVSRAYGRPAEADELARLTALYREAATIEGHAAGLRLTVQAVLLSPHFLYRPELGEPESVHDPVGEPHILSSFELANALSFAVAGARPEPDLLARAQLDPAFRDPASLASEARRLLGTPRGRDHLVRFVRSWLGVLDLHRLVKVPEFFPDYSLAVRDQLEREMQGFLAYALDERHGTLEHVLTLPVTFAGPDLARVVYRLDFAAVGAELPPPLPMGEQMLRPELRRGVLSLAGWLAAHSPVHRSSPVDRGIAIRTRMFCQTLPSPPPGAFATAPGVSDGTATTRSKFERHSSDPQCSGCHKLVDPIGFGLEMMDALGRYRQTEHGLVVDSSGALVGTDVDGPFVGPAELALRLAKSAELRDCFVVQLFRHVEGREPVASDRSRLERLQRSFRSGDGRIDELLIAMVVDPDFALRSAEP